MGRKIDGEAAFRLSCVTLMVMSLLFLMVVARGFDGLCDCNRSIESPPLFHQISVYPSIGRPLPSFQLVDSVVEILHREWLHCVLVLFALVLVFVFVLLRR